MTRPVLALCPGEPAGVGPDLALALAVAHDPRPADLVILADPSLLAARAKSLGLDGILPVWQGPQASPGAYVLPVPLATPARAGQLDARNAPAVLAALDRAIAGCGRGEFSALVTGPVHKGIINDAGIPFTGHTEYLADRSHTDLVVMMLASRDLRVALATTHLPLADVSRAITRAHLTRIIEILHADLRTKFGFDDPRIQVLGLNPHAGEGGHLGREEIEVIEPVLAALRARGWRLAGPVPADTAFLPARLAGCDAVLAMYHDQGLPVLKHHDFAHAINITLGLPFVRTSVDHGTALELAGTGRADPSSLRAALAAALTLCR